MDEMKWGQPQRRIFASYWRKHPAFMEAGFSL
jgi:hypothetical protein